MLRLSSKAISVLCHPLLILTYAWLLLMIANPYQFGSSNTADAFRHSLDKTLRVIQLTFMFPMFVALMLRPLGFISSLEMPTREERYVPFIATGICYLWNFINLYWAGDGFPRLFTVFSLGATVGLFTAFLINLFTKISIHAVGMGGLVAIALITYPHSYAPIEPHVLLIILLAGMVGTARLQLKAHEPQDVYGGYLVGFGAQMLAVTVL